MWGEFEEPPGTAEEGPPETLLEAKKTCKQNKNQLESLKEIMLKNKQSLKKKEEEVQEYASRLSKIKSRTKLSKRSKEGASTSKEAEQPSEIDSNIKDISQATTPKARSSLLQRMLVENRKVFEQRNKEMTETKRAVEEKVEAIRQQLDEKDLALMELQKDQTVTPVIVTSEMVIPVPESTYIQEKDNKIIELNNKISELEAVIMDLQENLKEKDSVIDSKTKAITLMSADLSKKGKTTLDTLEDTKGEMRTMQEHFVLLESSLKQKNDNLLQQLHERDDKISELDDTIKKYENELVEQKLAEIANSDLSRSTLDTLADTKSAMTSMQENFILIESTLKMKNDNLLKQLEDYDIKLAEANEKIFQLESGKGIVKTPSVDDLQYNLNKLKENNRQLQDEKYELQKSIADMQNKIIASKSMHENGAIMEKDNRIAELENLVEELKRSNDLLEEESKAELQKQLAELSLKNEDYSNRIMEFEKLVHNLEIEKNDIASKLPSELSIQKENEKTQKLTKELEELNKNMIKIKAQHKNKVKGLQKQLENFKMVSDANAELVRLGNQVTLLEEEKGNLQLSLVDFDELKASAGDWQERIAELESRVSMQTDEIQKNIDAIAILENQKLDLIQELHLIKLKVSELEAEVADAENHRVTAEMKVVDLEEQLESVHKITESKLEMSPNVNELLQKIETLQQENTELSSKLTKLEEKSTSDAGSTESFETIHEVDKNELLKKIEDLTQRNDELTLKLTKLEERNSSHAGSTESFEAINDVDKNELLKKIDQLTQENNDLTVKLNRNDEKGSSDTGSTESFERIPEHNESTAKIELLTQENNDLVIKMTKLEEKLLNLETSHSEIVESNDVLQIRKNELDVQNQSLLDSNKNLSTELTKLKSQISDMEEENINFQKRIEALTADNNDLVIQCIKLEERLSSIQEKQSNTTERTVRSIDNEDQMNALLLEKNNLEKTVIILQEKLVDQTNNVTLHGIETNDTKLRMNKLLEEYQQIIMKNEELEKINQHLVDDLNKTIQEKEELSSKIEFFNKKDRKKEEGKEVSVGLQVSVEEFDNKRETNVSEILQDELVIVESLEKEIKHSKELIKEQTNLIEELKLKLSSQEEELEIKTKQIFNLESSEKEKEILGYELKEMSEIMEQWKLKYANLEEKMNALEVSKVSIENCCSKLREDNTQLLIDVEQKQIEREVKEKEMEMKVSLIESQLQKERTIVSMKEDEIVNLKTSLESKDQDLHKKYLQIQNEMITIDDLQDQINNYKSDIQQKDLRIASMSQELEKVNDVLRSKEDEIYSLEKKHSELHEKLTESIPRTEYNKLLEELHDNEILVNNMQSKIDERMKEKHELLVQLENISQQNQEVQYQLTQKHEELQNVLMIKEELNAQIIEKERAKTDTETRLMDLESSLEKNVKFIDELQSELKDAYKKMGQSKIQHAEDIEMHNRRLEDTIKELNVKIQECENLKTELLEKEKVISQNLLEEAKNILETKVVDLEQKLVESENKKQAQLEKMKKIVATLKRKTAMCQEFEARIAELEEKWTSEKDEKEAKNKKNQEVENSMREKDNKIADLEEKLNKAKSETADSLEHVEKLTNEITVMKDKMFLLINQISELEDELHKRIAQYSNDIETEKLAKQTIIEEYESSKNDILQRYDEQQLILEETKENARELSVRMQVMETEYVEHLGLIKHLQAENALLLSKQIQINEKLENVEKESEDRRLLIDKLQKKIVSSVDMITQTSEDELRHDARQIVQQCDHCEQCQTIVQALEAKLQEREAEIENLDNELANSIGNFVQMRESFRFGDMMNQSGMRNRTMEDPYNDLLSQYNILLANNEEIKAKLEYVVKENEEMIEKSKTLEALNATLQEKILGMEETVMQDEKYNDLLKKYNERENELQNLQEKIESIENETKRSVEMLQVEITVFKSEKKEYLEKYKLLNDQKEGLEQELEHLKIEYNEHNQRLIELESELNKINQKNATAIEETVNVSARRSSDIIIEEKYTVPQLFDASKIFGSDYNKDEQKETAKLEDFTNNKDLECLALKKEIDNLHKQMNEDKAQMLISRNAYEEELRNSQELCQTMQIEINNLQLIIEDKVKQIGLLNDEMNNVQSILELQSIQQETRFEELRKIKDNEIQSLQVELNTTKDILTSLSIQCDEQNNSIEIYKLQISNLEREMRDTVNNDSTIELQNQLMEIKTERDNLQLQMNDLARSLEELKQRNIVVQSVKEEESTKSVIQNLEAITKDDEDKLQKATIGSNVSTATQMVPIVEQSTYLSVDEASDKFNTDEDTWGWNADDVQTTDDHHNAQISIIPSIEIQLRTKIDEMEKKLLDLEEEKVKLLEESKTSQIRSGKMVKKLKEYKVQIDNLQQQLKSQKSMTGLCELDSAIEEELRSQIVELEKNLKESSTEHKHLLLEKEGLLKRIGVLELAHDRFIEMKEKQDMDMEVFRLENKDLTNKIKFLEARFSEENVTPESDLSSLEPAMSVKHLQKRSTDDVTSDVKKLCDKYKEELETVKDDMEALATENEQLQHYLEEQKSRISTLEGKLIASEEDSQELKKLRERKEELQSLLKQLEEENEITKKQFEERLDDISKETVQMEERIKELNQRLEISETRANELQKREENIIEEKLKMEEKMDKAKITEEKLFTVSESLTEVTELLNARVQEVADLKQELQKQYVTRKEAEEKLQNNIKDLSYELKERKKELDDLRGAFTVKETELIQQKSFETVSLLVSEATQELVQKHAIDIEERNKEIHDLRDKLNALQITVDEYASKLSKKSTQEETVTSLSLNLQDKVKLLENVKEELLRSKEEFQQRELQWENESKQHSLNITKYLSTIRQLEDRLNESENESEKLRKEVVVLSHLEREIVDLRAILLEKESILNKLEEKLQRSEMLLNDKNVETKELQIQLQYLDEMKNNLHDSAEEIIRLTSELETVRVSFEETKVILKEKEASLRTIEEKLKEKQIELDRVTSNNSFLQNQQSSTMVDGLPLFRMGNDNEDMLRSTIEKLKIQLEEKQQEIDHFKYIVEENTYPRIIQEMQDNINHLYNEKAQLENALQASRQSLLDKHNEMESLIERLDAQDKDDSISLTRERERRSVQDQEGEIVRLQNELHIKEQEINELKYVIAEKDSQLSQVNSDPSSYDYELRENLQSLTAELYSKEQEIRQLKSSIDESQNEILRLKDLEKALEETIERLTSEKETIRLKSEELLEKKLFEKEQEIIFNTREKFMIKNEEFLDKLEAKDFEDLCKNNDDWYYKFAKIVYNKDEEIEILKINLKEKEKYIDDLISMRNIEINKFHEEINEKNIRVKELIELSENDQRNLVELRRYIEDKEIEIKELTDRLEVTVKEYEMIQHALKKDFPITAGAIKIHEEGEEIERTTLNTSDIDIEGREDSKYSNELDLALYMLHQRDVRCEELTHELMQLLEERDTLQLRLSNAIRINEELRKISSDSSPRKDVPGSSETTDEPLVEHPSPSKSDGPVEIAKEALDAPMEEDKAALSLKLSQLHTVGHTKDVRLRDERELRHTQQMSLLAHKDVLSTLPPEAAAKLVNANYTLSRDVQSQSSVLLNWLWGKSTPKVMHM